MPDDRRSDHNLRKLIILGNCLCMWASRLPVAGADAAELNGLLDAWDRAITGIRTERKEIEHISL